MKNTEKFIIQDWCSNTLQHNMRFNFGRYGQDFGVPKIFESFEDAWECIDEKLAKNEEDYQEYLVLKIRE